MHLISLTVPFYSHLKSQKSLLESFLRAWHRVTVITHSRLWELVQQIGAEHYIVDRMDSFLDDPAIEAANGIAYTAAMLYEMATKIDKMTQEVKQLNPDGIIFDSATRWWKMISLRVWVPTIAWSAMYPPLYQYNRTSTIRKQLFKDLLTAPHSFIRIWQSITWLIFDHKPKDYDELYTWLYNDNDIKTCTAIPRCLFEDNELENLHFYQHHWVDLSVHTEDDPEWLWLQREERNIIYVSLGTLISIDQGIINTLEQASQGTILFVVSTWPHGTQGQSQNVVRKSFLPQKQILDVSMACITHWWINTVIECMARKLPMICVPFLTDQHLYSDRIQQLWIATVHKKSLLRRHNRLISCLSNVMMKTREFEQAYQAIDLKYDNESYQSLITRFEESILEKPEVS